MQIKREDLDDALMGKGNKSQDVIDDVADRTSACWRLAIRV